MKDYIRPNQGETFAALVKGGLIDTHEPTNSIIRQKPTMQVKHGGGIRMVLGDRSYKQFRKFPEDYAATSAGKYKIAEELSVLDDEVSRVSEDRRSVLYAYGRRRGQTHHPITVMSVKRETTFDQELIGC